MKSSKLLVALSASTLLFTAVASQAMPIFNQDTGASVLEATQVGFRWFDDDDHHEGRGDDDDEGRGFRRQAYDDDHGDDDDDDGGYRRGGTVQPQSATPPSNGLFTPGTKANAQMN